MAAAEGGVGACTGVDDWLDGVGVDVAVGVDWLAARAEGGIGEMVWADPVDLFCVLLFADIACRRENLGEPLVVATIDALSAFVERDRSRRMAEEMRRGVEDRSREGRGDFVEAVDIE